MDWDDNVIVALCVRDRVCARDRGTGPAISRHTQVCPTFRLVGAMHIVHVHYQCNHFAMCIFSVREAAPTFSVFSGMDTHLLTLRTDN